MTGPASSASVDASRSGADPAEADGVPPPLEPTAATPGAMPTGEERRRWMAGVVDAWEGRLVAYATRQLRDVERARDVVQDAFLRLWQQDDPALLGVEGPWLYRTCRNRAFDVLRKERRMHVTSEAGALADRDHAATTDPGSPADASAAEPRHVLDLVHRLPPRQQEAVRLRFQGGLAYREIAEVMETSVTNVGVLLHSAIRRLREWADGPEAAPAAGGAS